MTTMTTNQQMSATDLLDLMKRIDNMAQSMEYTAKRIRETKEHLIASRGPATDLDMAQALIRETMAIAFGGTHLVDNDIQNAVGLMAQIARRA